MYKKYARISVLAMLAVVVLACAAFAAPVHLQSPNWEPNTKLVLNQMLDMYGTGGAKHTENPRPYAVFDYDNTISILDVEEQLAIYQLENLRFAITPDMMYKVLITGVPDVNKSCGEDYDNKTVAEVAADAAAAYAKLYAKGWVAADASKAKYKEEWLQTADWKEFATKARWLYDAIGDTYSVDVSYPWITYWFTGMTSKEIQQLAYESHTFYDKLGKTYPFAWKKCKWTSPANYSSKAGQLTIGFNQCITVSPELKELIAALDADGIDMWICSASHLDVIKAAPAAFGLKGVDGIVAMTNKFDKNGKMLNEYDYALHDQTQGVGKSTTIVKCIAPKYKGRGPILTCFDSQGDFNFVTEFKDTAVGLCLNRQRKDDAGLCAAIAVWQNKHGIDLPKAQAMGDTRYVLQGREENNGAHLWAKTETHLLGKGTAVFSSKAEKWYAMLENGTKPGELLNQCTKLTHKLKTYIGYKTR